MLKMKNKKIILLRDELQRRIKGREDLIDTVILALCSNEHILVIGKHGEAKSFLVHKLAQITSLQVHYQQVHNELTLKEVVGLLDPLAYQKGKLELLKTKFWTANVLFFDEFLRGRSEFLDFLLEVMVERKCSKTVLGEVQLPQLISVIATSNPLTEEYNTERLDLAMKDRFSFIVNVDHLIENEANREVIKSILEDNELETREIKITAEELKAFRNSAIANVKIDSDVVVDLFYKLKEKGFIFSTRFIKKYAEIVKVHAYLNGRNIAEDEDYSKVAMMMLQNRYDKLTKDVIQDVVDEVLYTMQYRDLLDQVRELETIDDIQVKLEKAVDLLEKTREEYLELPEKIKKEIDNVRDTVFNILNDVVILKQVKPELIKKLDSEEFKSIIKQYIKLHTVETKFVKNSELEKVKQVLNRIQYCNVKEKTSEDGRYKKFVITANLEKIESFEEIEIIREELENINALSLF